MKYIILLLIAMVLLACKKEIVPTNPCANNRDVLLSEEQKWINYKVGDSIIFISSVNQIKYIFKVTDYYLYYPIRADYCKHQYIISETAFNNKNLDYRITGLTIGYKKNSSSLSTTGKVENAIGISLHNEKAATGMFPSVSSSSWGQGISLDKRDDWATIQIPILNNFTVNKKSYQNVYKLQMQFNPNIGATYLYVNRDFGFLRIDFADGEIWERVL